MCRCPFVFAVAVFPLLRGGFLFGVPAVCEGVTFFCRKNAIPAQVLSVPNAKSLFNLVARCLHESPKKVQHLQLQSPLLRNTLEFDFRIFQSLIAKTPFTLLTTQLA